MSYRLLTLVERSVTPPSLWTGKKLFQTPAGVAPAAHSTTMAITTTAAMIRAATRGPDPVRDRGGIDIGFLECCRRAGGTTGQQRGFAVRDMRLPERGRRTAASYPRRPRLGAGSGVPGRTADPRPCPAESGDNAVMVRPRSMPSDPGRPTRPSRFRSASRARIASAVAVVAGTAATLLAAPTVLAHGGTVPPPPDALSFPLGWSFDPLVWLPAIVALLLWRHGVRTVARGHPEHPVARRRTVSWTLGVFALLVALDSGIERYDTTLFSVHMVQHMILTLVGPPLLVFAGPITLLLQASSPATRKRWILPVLHSRVMRALSFPVVSWLLFAGVMWGSHFSPLFDLSLENQWIHSAEHALYLTAGLLFWWPVVGPDPSPWRMSPPVRVLYVGLQMPQNTFLALAIYMASVPLYAHYVTTIRSWGPTPLEDQQLAGGLMWVGGDIAFITAVGLLVLAWMRWEDRRTIGEDRRLDAERAAIREREVALAARRAAEAQGEGRTPG